MIHKLLAGPFARGDARRRDDDESVSSSSPKSGRRSSRSSWKLVDEMQPVHLCYALRTGTIAIARPIAIGMRAPAALLLRAAAAGRLINIDNTGRSSQQQPAAYVAPSIDRSLRVAAGKCTDRLADDARRCCLRTRNLLPLIDCSAKYIFSPIPPRPHQNETAAVSVGAQVLAPHHAAEAAPSKRVLPREPPPLWERRWWEGRWRK